MKYTLDETGNTITNLSLLSNDTDAIQLAGQNQHFLKIRPIDTIYKFFVVYTDPKTKAIQPFNFIEGKKLKYSLIFVLADGSKYEVDRLDVSGSESISDKPGEIFFRVTENDYNEIKTALNFMIVSKTFIYKPFDNSEFKINDSTNMIYQGRVLDEK